jgi:hypothetical protein
MKVYVRTDRFRQVTCDPEHPAAVPAPSQIDRRQSPPTPMIRQSDRVLFDGHVASPAFIGGDDRLVQSRMPGSLQRRRPH